MSELFYIQCLLHRRIRGEGPLLMTFLPEKFAIPHKYLKLKNEKGEWENSWRVLEVYSQSRAPASAVEARERDYKHQRDVSDI